MMSADNLASGDEPHIREIRNLNRLKEYSGLDKSDSPRKASEKKVSGKLRVALLTGGNDKHYAEGLTAALTGRGVMVDIVGSDDLVSSAFVDNRLVCFENLRGNQDPKAPLSSKMRRIASYYKRLFGFALRAKATIFHILWNNRFEYFDRTFMLAYYKMCGRRIAFTAHNVNAAKRDQVDSRFNRWTLKLQYTLADHIFVHTDRMSSELQSDFAVHPHKISVIPFGINNSVSSTSLTAASAREALGLQEADRVLLFFGQIAPYKGLEYLLHALAVLRQAGEPYRLIIAGKLKWNEIYWTKMKQIMIDSDLEEGIIQRVEFIPDKDIEIYFKAADCLILPYVSIFQSGVLFLAYGFGLPVIATDVGSMREEVIEGKTGFVCPPCDPHELAGAIRQYFASDLYRNLGFHRDHIKAYGEERHSWDKVAEITTTAYARLLAR